MIYPVMLCAFAGLSTALGGGMVVLSGGIDNKKMSFSQGFAAGVMLAVSLFDLMVESFDRYYAYMPVMTAFRAVLSLFFWGWIAGSGINGIVLPRKIYDEEENMAVARRMAVITTIVMVIHNLPEGMLTMFTATQDMNYGARIAVAVALHNMPEGMVIASPVLYVTKSKWKAFFQSLWAGMAELFGGTVAYLLLKDFIAEPFLNGLMPVIAGIMCQAAICELIPSGMKISNNQHTMYGILTGIGLMAIGIFLL